MTKRSLASRTWYDLLKNFCRLACVIVYRIRYSGRENVPSEGPVLVVCNHQSYLDPVAIGAGCPQRLSYMARKTLFRFSPFGWLIHSVNAIPLDTEGIGFGGVKETLRRLKRGEMVLIFPEGERCWDSEVAPFQPGFATLAIRGRSTILPVGIEGAFEAWPRFRKLPRPGNVRVHYGDAISAEVARELGAEGLVEEVRRRVCSCQARLRRDPVFAQRRR